MERANDSGLPADVDEIMDLIGVEAEMSGCFKWNEQAKVKADMMNVPRRWQPSRVSAEALREKCRVVGLAEDETVKIAQYRNFRFEQEPTD
ncbi:hypothetical protein ACFZBU_39525 [Embleya sp. NPDC008237]|uniref:hypothetical protein n=1 Tax=Embleya sp. NPDC008237 TaxID=3363978 RepID=UPI0036EA86E4